VEEFLFFTKNYLDISKFNKFYQKIEKCITPEEMKKINKDDKQFKLYEFGILIE